MSDLTAQIRSTLEELTKLDHAHARLQEVEQSLAQMNEEWSKLDGQLESELDDIKKLEGLSLKGLFHKVLGSKEEELERERQEYLALTLRIKELNKSIEIVEYEKDILSKKVVKRDAVIKDLQSLKDMRLKEILRTNAAQKDELVVLLDQEDKTIRLRQELEEALQAGNQSSNSLKKIINFLKKAEDWGQWDAFGGRSRHSKHMKMQSLDYAAGEAIQCQHLLQIFKRELADVGYQENFRLQVDSFRNFSTIFFDNLISDWIVQRKIADVLNSVINTFNKVQLLLQSLTHEMTKAESLLKDLANKKHALLIS